MNERRVELSRSRRAVILPADRQIVEVYTAYFDRIDSQEICPSLEPAVDYWGESYLDGRATQEQLAEAAKHILAVSNALKSLPDKLRSEVETQHDNYHHADKIGVVLMDPDYFPQMPTVVELITAGVPPTDDIRSSLRRRPILMKPITDFSRTLFPLSEEGIDLLPITVPLIEQTLTSYFPKNYPGVISLSKKAEYIMAVYRAGFSFLQSLNSENTHFLFWCLCTNNAMLEYGPEVATLLDHHIFPTDVLTDFLRKNPDGLAYLKELQEATAAGRFDPQSPLQRDLEYTKYLQMRKSPSASPEIPQFSSLDFIEPETNELTKTEQIEAEAAALEAAKLYWLVRKQIEAGRKVAVVGNERYGWLFVVEPLRGMLENLGARVGKCRVSSRINPQQIPDLPKLADFIASEEPDDIIIVDGTKNPSAEEKARFPGAMIGFVDWFTQFAPDFKPAHWLPYAAPHIIIDNLYHTAAPFTPPDNQHGNLILANPVHPKNCPSLPTELRNHQPAYFDDPDSKAAYRAKIAFTPYGLQKLYEDKTEEDLVAAVQRHMGLILEEMIEKTDPKLSPQ